MSTLVLAVNSDALGRCVVVVVAVVVVVVVVVPVVVPVVVVVGARR